MRLARPLFISFLISSILGPLLAVTFFLLRPSVLVNATLIRGVIRKIAPGSKTDWKDFKVEAQSLGWLKHRYLLHWTEPRFETPDGSVKARAEDLLVGLELEWSPRKAWTPHVNVIGPLKLAEGELSVKPVDQKQAAGRVTEEVSGSPEQFLPAWLAGAVRESRWHEVDLELNRGEIFLDGSPWVGEVWFRQTEPDATSFRLHAAARTQYLKRAKKYGSDTKIEAELVSQGDWRGPWRIELQGRAQLGYNGSPGAVIKTVVHAVQDGHASVRWNLDASAESRQFLATIRGANGKITGTGGMIGLGNPQAVAIDFDGTYRDFGSKDQRPMRVAANGCEVAWHRQSNRSVQSEISADCGLWATLPLPSPVELPSLKPPLGFEGKLHAKFETSESPSPSSHWKGDARLAVDAFRWSVAETGPVIVTARASGIPSEFPKGSEMEAHLETSIEVHDFRELVKLLDPSSLAIPAPANALEGKILVDARGNGDLHTYSIPFTARTELHSMNGGPQRLNTKSRGEFRVEEGIPRVVASVELTDVAVALPRLNLERPPQLFPDSRITTRRQRLADSMERPFDYEVVLKTPPGHPIRVVTNLAKAEVPISLQIRLAEGEDPTGSVKIEQFPLRLFNRDAEIKSFKILLEPQIRDYGESKGTVDGVLQVNYTDYIVKVLVTGPMERPEIHLTSDPPLAEDQLYAVLVFGRPLEELDSDEGTSVGNVRAAVADGAVGFASLYLLAATPVESVGYDSTSGVFSAKVRLGEGTSLNVGGSETGLQRVGIRRRLTRHWTVTTDVLSSTTGANDRSVSAFLEWVNRY